MAWQRMMATSWEEAYAGDIIVSTAFGLSHIGLTSEKAHTGQWSIKDSYRSRYGFHLQNTFVSARMGCWCSIGQPFSNGTVIAGVYGYQASLGDVTKQYRIAQSDDGLEFILQRATETTFQELDRVALAELNVSVGQWVAMSLSARAGNPGTFVFYVNGQSVFTISEEVFPSYAFFFLGRGNYAPTVNTYLDDIFVDVSSDLEPETVPPSPRFVASFPLSEGQHQDWKKSGGIDKASFLSLRERRKRDMPILYSTAADQVQTFKIDHSRLYEDYTVHSVIVRARALSGDYAGNPSLRFVVTDGTHLDESPPISLSVGYRPVHHVFSERPGGGPWGVSMDGIEVGVKS